MPHQRIPHLLSYVAVCFLAGVGASSCVAAKTCSAQTCSTGCCTADGECEPGWANGACGSAGNLCTDCSLSAQICGAKVCVALGAGGGSSSGGGTGGGATGGGTGGGATGTGGGATGTGGGATGGGTGGGATGGGTGGGATGGGTGGGATGGGTGGGRTGGGAGGGVTGGGTGGGAAGGGTGGGAAGGGTGGGTGGGATGGGTGGGATGGGTGGGGSSVNLDMPLTPGDPGAADVRLEVRSNQGRHPISPYIYGTNQPANTLRNRYGLVRFGGNRLTAYNWENNASNAGSDYNFQNDSYLSTSNVPGAAVTTRMDAARAYGAAFMVTVPILDYVAADKSPGGDVRNSPNYLTTRFRQNRPIKGAPLSLTPDTSDGFVYQDEFVAWVRANANQTPIFVSLDNEPDLWSDTHREIHPANVTYAELVTRTINFAKGVKQAWPTVPVTGFVSYGWYGFVSLQGASDAMGRDFTDFFLAQMRAAEMSEGRRLVDYLDLHWYPEATGGGQRIYGTGTGAATVAARVQAPRSLWDTTYTETSWIASNLGQPIRLIPRMQAKINTHYPNTLLAFTEWNYGAGDHISGGVATADVLGIFGRDSVGLATYWKQFGTEVFADAAFEAFRNFDGARGAFGDTSLSATSSVVSMASIYASVDAINPARTVLVAINKDTVARTAALTVAHPVNYGRLKVYTLTSAGANLMPGADVTATATNAYRYTMPPLSVSVLVPTP